MDFENGDVAITPSSTTSLVGVAVVGVHGMAGKEEAVANELYGGVVGGGGEDNADDNNNNSDGAEAEEEDRDSYFEQCIMKSLIAGGGHKNNMGSSNSGGGNSSSISLSSRVRRTDDDHHVVMDSIDDDEDVDDGSGGVIESASNDLCRRDGEEDGGGEFRHDKKRSYMTMNHRHSPDYNSESWCLSDLVSKIPHKLQPQLIQPLSPPISSTSSTSTSKKCSSSRMHASLSSSQRVTTDRHSASASIIKRIEEVLKQMEGISTLSSRLNIDVLSQAKRGVRAEYKDRRSSSTTTTAASANNSLTTNDNNNDTNNNNYNNISTTETLVSVPITAVEQKISDDDSVSDTAHEKALPVSNTTKLRQMKRSFSSSTIPLPKSAAPHHTNSSSSSSTLSALSKNSGTKMPGIEFPPPKIPKNDPPSPNNIITNKNYYKNNQQQQHVGPIRTNPRQVDENCPQSEAKALTDGIVIPEMTIEKFISTAKEHKSKIQSMHGKVDKWSETIMSAINYCLCGHQLELCESPRAYRLYKETLEMVLPLLNCVSGGNTEDSESEMLLLALSYLIKSVLGHKVYKLRKHEIYGLQKQCETFDKSKEAIQHNNVIHSAKQVPLEFSSSGCTSPSLTEHAYSPSGGSNSSSIVTNNNNNISVKRSSNNSTAGNDDCSSISNKFRSVGNSQAGSTTAAASAAAAMRKMKGNAKMMVVTTEVYNAMARMNYINHFLTQAVDWWFKFASLVKKVKSSARASGRHNALVAHNIFHLLEFGFVSVTELYKVCLAVLQLI